MSRTCAIALFCILVDTTAHAADPVNLRPDAGWETASAHIAPDAMTSYAIDQAIDDASGTLEARMTLGWTNRTGAPVSALPLLLHPNASDEGGGAGGPRLSVLGVAGAAFPNVRLRVVRPTLVFVDFGRPVAAGERVTLELRYRAALRALGPNANDVFYQAMGSMASMASGTHSSDYGLVGVGDGLLTVASAYPMAAPWTPGSPGGFDTSPPPRVGDLAWNEVATFNVRTVLPAGMRAVTNAVDIGPLPLPAAPGSGAAVVFLSSGSCLRDFVLVAGRDLGQRTRRVGATLVRSVFRESDADAGQRVLDTAARALATFEARFGPYPFTELDVVEASLVGGAGGVEFPGLVLIAGMMYRPASASTHPIAALTKLWSRLGGAFEGALGGALAAPPATSAKPAPDKADPTDQLLAGSLEFTVAHEVGHEYFAELIASDSHREAAFDEPLAQYAATVAMEDVHGRAAARAMLAANAKLQYALYRLLGGSDRPVVRDNATYGTPLEYAALVYGKAPYLWIALEERLGRDRLHAALARLVAAHRFGIVTTHGWIAELADALPGRSGDIRALAARWLDEVHGDQDLGVDDTGDYFLRTMFPPEVADALRSATSTIGMSPAELLRMLFGGGLGSEAPLGAGIDPARALDALLPETH